MADDTEIEVAKPVDRDDDRAASDGVEDRPGEVVPRDSGVYDMSTTAVETSALPLRKDRSWVRALKTIGLEPMLSDDEKNIKDRKSNGSKENDKVTNDGINDGRNPTDWVVVAKVVPRGFVMHPYDCQLTGSDDLEIH